MKTIFYIISLVLFCLCVTLRAEGEIVSHSVGANVRASYIMPTHGFYNGYNSSGRPLRAGGSVHIDYSFSYSPESALGRMYPGAYQGAGIGAQTFSAHEALGTPISLYIFQGSPFVLLSDRLSLGYEWNLGLSAGWKPDEYMLTASRLNIYINVGVFADWRINKYWSLQFGPEYTHYSNGDTSFPNGGANTINFRVGARRHFNRDSEKYCRPRIFEPVESTGRIKDHITYDITLFGAWRADRMLTDAKLYLINEKFLIAGIQFNPLYHLNQSLSFGPSLDIIYDRSANLNAYVDENKELVYSYPDMSRQCAAGLSVRGELRMPVFAVNIGAGYNFSYKESDLRGLYCTFILKTFVTDSMFINFGYRLSSVLYSHNLMFGLGWRFNNN